MRQPLPRYVSELRQIETISGHDLVPRGDEVVYKLRLCIVAAIDLSKGAQFGVRTEDEVNARPSPYVLTRGAALTGEGVCSSGGWRPLEVVVQDVDEEVVRQRARTAREHADG